MFPPNNYIALKALWKYKNKLEHIFLTELMKNNLVNYCKKQFVIFIQSNNNNLKITTQKTEQNLV